MLFLPPEGGNLTVQDLDRPPLGHNRDGTSAPANATPAGPALAATRRDPSRPPSPNGQPGNVSPKATRKLSTRTHALPTLHSRRNEQAWFSCCADRPVRRCTVQCPGMTGAQPAGLAAELGPETSSGQPDPCQGASCASVDRRPHPRDLRCGDASKPGHARSTAAGARLLALDRRRRSGARPASYARRPSPGCGEGLSTSVVSVDAGLQEPAVGPGDPAIRVPASRHACNRTRVRARPNPHYRTGGHRHGCQG